MSRRIKKWMAALMCGLLMMGGVVSVEAADHACVATETYREIRGYTSNGNNHIVTSWAEYSCQFCKKKLRAGEEKSYESHDHAGYNDLGHQGAHDHKYEICCSKCGYVHEIITITTCEGKETGHHATP